MTTKYKNTTFTLETRTLNGMLYITASAFNGSLKYELKLDERNIRSAYIKQLLNDIHTGTVELSKPDIHSHCVPSSLMLSHVLHTENISFSHSYELKYTTEYNVDELIAKVAELESIKTALVVLGADTKKLKTENITPLSL